MTGANETIARRQDAVLRIAAEADLDAVDALTVEGYRAIQESYVSHARRRTATRPSNVSPSRAGTQRKTKQNRRPLR